MSHIIPGPVGPFYPKSQICVFLTGVEQERIRDGVGAYRSQHLRDELREIFGKVSERLIRLTQTRRAKSLESGPGLGCKVECKSRVKDNR